MKKIAAICGAMIIAAATQVYGLQIAPDEALDAAAPARMTAEDFSHSSLFASGAVSNHYGYHGWSDFSYFGWDPQKDTNPSIQPNLDFNPPPTAVPEPATLLLFGAALVGLAGITRQRMKK